MEYPIVIGSGGVHLDHAHVCGKRVGAHGKVEPITLKDVAPDIDRTVAVFIIGLSVICGRFAKHEPL